MTKANGMPVEQHQKLGRLVKDFEREILQFVIANHYKASSRERKALEKLLKASSDVRCVMDDAAFKEHSGLDTHELVNFYYGKNSIAVVL